MPGTISMQSTGQKTMHASQPVQPDWTMTASFGGVFLRGGFWAFAAAISCAFLKVSSLV